jgi:pheromone shutdown protein TraB
MFRWISIISFAVVLAGVVLHHVLFPCGYKPRFSLTSLVRKKVHLFTLLFPEQKLSPTGKIRKLAFMLGLLSFAVLLLTGFGAVLLGIKLQGYWLMLHATFAAVFIACAAVVAVLGAGQYRFGQDTVTNEKQGESRHYWPADAGLGVKSGFWLLLILSLPLTLSMALSMLPWFGTEAQEFLYITHRWSALAFSAIGIVELYLLVRTEIRKEFE